MVGRPSRQAIYDRLDAAFAELRDRMGGLPNPVEAEGIWTTIWYEEAHNSTAIEGNTLVLKQVERLLADGVAVGDGLGVAVGEGVALGRGVGVACGLPNASQPPPATAITRTAAATTMAVRDRSRSIGPMLPGSA